jgi:hypothetical protein
MERPSDVDAAATAATAAATSVNHHAAVLNCPYAYDYFVIDPELPLPPSTPPPLDDRAVLDVQQLARALRDAIVDQHTVWWAIASPLFALSGAAFILYTGPHTTASAR